MKPYQAHWKFGGAVGRIDYDTYSKVYCADGSVLRSNGRTWRKTGRIKASFTPVTAYAAALEYSREWLAQRPGRAALRAEIHRLFGMSHWATVWAILEVLHDDLDGAWGELVDLTGQRLDVAVVENLIRLWRARGAAGPLEGAGR